MANQVDMFAFTTAPFWLDQLSYFVRLLIACVCGAAIGFERKNRLKEAGIRTHLIVSLASALMMIVSKYGFFDVVIYESISLDASRIAAGIVSGIGFLGAGIIFVRKQAVSGLTTAAGIWATMGVGMAVGSGMYVVGMLATVIIIIAQIILHRNLHWLKIPVAEPVAIRIQDNAEAIAYLQGKLAEHHIQVINIKADKSSTGYIDLELVVRMPQSYDVLTITNLFQNSAFIKSVEI